MDNLMRINEGLGIHRTGWLPLPKVCTHGEMVARSSDWKQSGRSEIRRNRRRAKEIFLEDGEEWGKFCEFGDFLVDSEEEETEGGHKGSFLADCDLRWLPVFVYTEIESDRPQITRHRDMYRDSIRALISGIP